ncbi:DNA polymerase I [Aquicella lusitana]|uniref:DNA polymerase I n=1 Tax=Aquicella lusitana TaxID=254246 RepID=A0A370GVE4_9COXI|nr:DNA polymerase I [Aquicella lusitana]RDI46544.1 DNA polymerase I [Aquicella lusitana]VVC74208.1 DNA polymerase I [Aquicella lusitana]
MADNKPLILVDGSSYLYRAFHALPALTNSKGFPTGAVYGMINMLKRLIADYQPENMAVVFDAKGKTFRDEIYKEYKATRQEMPGELVVQIEPIHRIITAMGIPLIMVEGVEADDVIGTLAAQAAQAGVPTLISTGDKDLAQLVNDHITLINTMTNTTLDPKGVQEKFGVPPERIIDYLTLVGDTSDNIPGVPQVGPKTAAKWLQIYGSLANIVANAEKISGKVGDNLRQSLSQLPLTQSLVTIKMDVDLPLSFADLKIKPADKSVLIDCYKEMEFKNWLSELLEERKENNTDKYKNYRIITDENAFNDLLKQIDQAHEIAFDTETTSLDYMNAQLVGLSIAFAPGTAFYVPFGHDYPGAPRQLTKEQVLGQLKPLLENPRIKKIGQNLKYDIEVLANAGIQLQGAAYDTMIESYVLDSASNSHSMDMLALKYLGWRTITFEDIAGKGSKQLCFNQIDVQQAGIYAAEDADVTLQLHHKLWPRIAQEPGLKHIFTDIEMPLIPVLAAMECHGVLIDPQKLEKQGKELKARLAELEEEAFILAGQPFNLNSPKQLQEILFERLKLPILQKTPTGQASTADGVLQELALDFTIARTIIEYRSLSKLISTYTSRLIEQIHPKTHRIHTSYNQTGTATGRLSSSEPNLQNIPIRTSEGRRIRQAFIAPEGYQLISADYSQIELRLMAHISEDAGLLHAFSQNLDIHQATAAEVWGVPLDQVTQEMRRNAKAINFGLIYGMSAFGLTRQLGIDRKAAQDYIDRYFARYPGVRAYMDNTRKLAKEKGYVQTLWGRRLYLPDINASQIPRQKAAERTAINAPLQGSAADIIKLAMIRIDRWLQQENIDARMIMQVHDELVFEAATDSLPQMMEGIRHHMSEVVQLRVPLLVSIGTGDNWDAASAH